MTTEEFMIIVRRTAQAVQELVPGSNLVIGPYWASLLKGPLCLEFTIDSERAAVANFYYCVLPPVEQTVRNESAPFAPVLVSAAVAFTAAMRGTYVKMKGEP